MIDFQQMTYIVLGKFKSQKKYTHFLRLLNGTLNSHRTRFAERILFELSGRLVLNFYGKLQLIQQPKVSIFLSSLLYSPR